jgi:hypothetical protein
MFCFNTNNITTPRTYTCSICKLEGHNATSCSDPCINERVILIELLIFTNTPTDTTIQNVLLKIQACQHLPTFWRRVWLIMRELVHSQTVWWDINRDYLEFILSSPSQLVTADDYKRRLFELIAVIEQDIRLQEEVGVEPEPIVDPEPFTEPDHIVEEELWYPQNIPEQIQTHTWVQIPIHQQINYDQQICFKMDTDMSVYYDHVDCPVCFDKITCDKCIALNCSHVFCTNCTPNIVKTRKCPICREQITQIRFTPSISPEAFNGL